MATARLTAPAPPSHISIALLVLVNRCFSPLRRGTNG